ncbi:MAG: ribose 5-phosphate isomerase B [Christensenellales bacterium]
MKIALASDHGGYRYKQAIKQFLDEKGIDFTDFGTDSEASCDYPDYVRPAAEAVARGEFTYGVFVCGTGIGVSITANKVRGIRAALVHDVFSAKATRAHNDANVITFGQRVIGEGLMLELLAAFLGTEFEGGRHQTRIDKITAIEE